MRSTIKDVARKANVSTATVSLVIHGHQRISTETRRKVLKAIEQLDYHPSRSARDLVSRKSGNIGFVLTEDHFLRTEPFYTQIFLGSEFEARKHPFYVILATIPTDYAQSDPMPRFILERSVDGIIVAGKVTADFVNNLNRYPFPVVYIDFYPPGGEHAAVLIDNINGAAQATQHLVDCGHRNIAFIGGDLEHPSINERFQGYRMALDRNRLDYNRQRVVTTEKATSRESGYNAARELLRSNQNISAIFACNDAMAIGAMRFFIEQGFKIPEDISIIGFDDIKEDIFTEPNLTTMSVPMLDMGAEALRLMCDIVDKNIKGPKKILMPVSLVQRDSTCRPKV